MYEYTTNLYYLPSTQRFYSSDGISIEEEPGPIEMPPMQIIPDVTIEGEEPRPTQMPPMETIPDLTIERVIEGIHLTFLDNNYNVISG